MNNNLNSVRIILNNQCNFNCFYCFREGYSNRHSKYLLEKSDYLRIIDMLVHKYRIKKIRFSGGEPLLSPHYFDLLVEIRKRFPAIDLGITTNGFYNKEIFRIRSNSITKDIRVNITVPAANRKEFEIITKCDGFGEVYKNLIYASEEKCLNTKINCVYIGKDREKEITDVILLGQQLNLDVKLLCLNINKYNQIKITSNRCSQYGYNDIIRFIKSLGYSHYSISSEKITASFNGHTLEAINCCESDPILYFRRFKTIRIYFDSKISVTGDFNRFYYAFDPKDPKPIIEETINSLTNEMKLQGRPSCPNQESLAVKN